MTRSSRILSAALLLLTCLAASAQNTARQESRKAALEKEILQLESQLRENSTKSTNALNTLTLVRKQLANRRALLEESRRELDSLNTALSGKKAQTRALQDKLDSMMLYHGRLVRNAYKNRDARIWYVYLLSSKNFAQATHRYAFLRDLSTQMTARSVRMKEVRAQLEEELKALEVMKADVQKLLAERQKEADRLKLEERESDRLVARLKQDKSFYQRQLTSKKKQVDALNKEIEKIIAQAMKDASGNTGASKGAAKAPVDYKLSSSFASNKGKLPWPADGPVVEKFGKHNHPVYTKLEMPFNNGVNIGLAKGTEVKAVFDGEVRRVIVMPGYNKCVLVQHGNYFTFYCKLGEVSVKAGDKVKTGGRIGVVDTIDGQTQLHFQVWQEKTPQNPEIWLRPR